MSELTVTLLRLSLLVLLWLFVFSIVGVLRGDLYGTRLVRRRTVATHTPRATGAARSARPKPRRDTRTPTRLTVTDGPLVGTSLPLREKGTLIGRSPESSLVLDDDYASGRHLRIYFDGEAWVAEDLQSTNGTFIHQDGQQHRLTAPTPVHVGTQLRIGRTVVELRG